MGACFVVAMAVDHLLAALLFDEFYDPPRPLTKSDAEIWRRVGLFGCFCANTHLEDISKYSDRIDGVRMLDLVHNKRDYSREEWRALLAFRLTVRHYER